MYRNRVELYGRLGRDPELKTTQGGTTIVNFSMATTRSWKDDRGNKNEETEWHNCVVFGKRAEVIAQWVSKGQMFWVEGRLKTSTWEDKETGKKMYKTEIIVEDFMFGDNPKKKQSENNSGYSDTSDQDAGYSEVVAMEDILFN